MKIIALYAVCFCYGILKKRNKRRRKGKQNKDTAGKQNDYE